MKPSKKSIQLKKELADSLKNMIENHEKSKKVICDMTTANITKLNALCAGNIDGFTIDRIISYIEILGATVKIEVENDSIEMFQ